MRDKERIRAWLEEHAGGLENSKTAPVIAAALAIGDREGVEVRALVRELRVVDGVDVGSWTRGFFIIRSPEEYDDVVRREESRYEDQGILVGALKRNRERFYIKLGLPLFALPGAEVRR